MDHKRARILERIKKHERWLERARKELEEYGDADRGRCVAPNTGKRGGQCNNKALSGETLCWFHKKQNA